MAHRRSDPLPDRCHRRIGIFPATHDPRIITGVGIVLVGLALSNLIRYHVVGKDTTVLHRLSAEERDERPELIRARAGNRAFRVSIIMIFTGLMWSSFAANGQLPQLLRR